MRCVTCVPCSSATRSSGTTSGAETDLLATYKGDAYPPRGTTFFLTPFLRGHGSGAEDDLSAIRLGYQRQTRLLAQKAADEPHPTRMRTPAAQPRRAGRLYRGQRPGRSRYVFVPRPVAI